MQFNNIYGIRFNGKNMSEVRFNGKSLWKNYDEITSPYHAEYRIKVINEGESLDQTWYIPNKYEKINVHLKNGKVRSHINVIADDVDFIRVQYGESATSFRFPAATTSVTYLKTDNFKSMNAMFYQCMYLTDVDTSNWNTINVEDMASAFSNCSSLTSLDLSSFDTSNVTNMQAMFASCSSLTSLDLSSFDTSNVIKLGSMFSGCNALEYLNLSSFDTSNVDKTNSVFKIIGLGFKNSPFIIDWGYDGTNYTKWTLTESECKYNYSFPWNPEGTFPYYMEYTIATNDDYPRVNSAISGKYYKYLPYNYPELDISITITKNDGTTTSDLNTFASDVKYIRVDYDEDTPSLKLEGTSSQKHCVSNIRYINTSEFTNMAYMFYYCGNLTHINQNYFRTNNATLMNNMFYYCNKLSDFKTTIFDTSNVTNMSNMFSYCRAFELLDLSSFDTSNVTDMSYMFYDCSKLKVLDMSNFNTSNVSSKGKMLRYVPQTVSFRYTWDNYTNWTLGEWDTEFRYYDYDNTVFPWNVNVNTEYYTEYTYANELCYPTYYEYDAVNGYYSFIRNLYNVRIKLKDGSYTDDRTVDPNEISLVRSFFDSSTNGLSFKDTTIKSLIYCNAKKEMLATCRSMFENCSYLESVNFSGFNAYNLRDLSYTFKNCINLKTVNFQNVEMSGANPSANILCYYTFENCTSLEGVDFSILRNHQVYQTTGMFKNCTSLKNATINVYNRTEEFGIALSCDYMFYGCTSLLSAKVKINTYHSSIEMDGMFDNCISLQSVDLSNITWNSRPDIVGNVIRIGHLPTFENVPETAILYIPANNVNWYDNWTAYEMKFEGTIVRV